MTLRDEMMLRIEAAGGLVVVDGRTMVVRAIMRVVMRDFLLQLLDGLRDRLSAVVADDAEVARNLDAALDDLARETEEHIAALLPTIQ